MSGGAEGAVWRAEAACEGFGDLTEDDVPDWVLSGDDYRAGAKAAAIGILRALEGR